MGEDVAAHETRHTFTEIEEYPDHEPRTASAAFERNRRQLIEVEKRGCFVCDMLGLLPPDKPYEAHHFLCEWSEWGNVDAAKMQRLFDAGFVDFYGHSARLKGQLVESPDDIRNLLILCPLHHRASGTGIHATTAPMWCSQAVARDGVDILKGSDNRVHS